MPNANLELKTPGELLDEISRLRNAAELALQVFSKLDRGGVPSVSYAEVIGVLKRSLRK